ncbi:phosphoesterase RecJ domain protein [Thermocrinis albus DSM 14484]|uniref:Single-stranded-DNA-specific exonuclease RecJ n=1 Tax=Thermocrinis albus (strain DSM 14484 / JCM 11386 / HI 11/12) TaxID=638303 RepID=D3SN08_THEAH|nr:DHH family phosphoesterase [Thermocrinis albus]ADC90138.1 phosphoesterase RecJ domain protein [Thermocrinis albus DSM 14484]
MKGLSGKEWNLLSERISPDPEMIRSYGYVVAQVMANRGVTAEALDLKLRKILPPHLIPNMDIAVERIAKAIKKRENILIYGDYDVDGVTASVLLYRFLRYAGAKVQVVLPNRSSGYGLNIDLVKKWDSWVDLLITVDNGTTALEELRGRSKDTIVLDHHNPHGELPPAILVNPKIDQNTPKDLREISSVGLAFYLITCLQRELQLDYDTRDELPLVAIGTLGDFMNLNTLNRILVYNGIRALNYYLQKGVKLLGLRLLIEKAGIPLPITSRDISFLVVPRLNSPGRVANPYYSFRLLSENRESIVKQLVLQIENFHQARKKLTEIAVGLAEEQLQKQKDVSIPLLKLEGRFKGVGGIVAGQLVSRIQKPVVVVSVNDNLSSASARSVEGIDIHSTLAPLAHLFVKWGGHSQAMGFTIHTHLLDVLEENLRYMPLPDSELRLDIDMELPIRRCDESLVEALRRMEPFGEGFPFPTFLSEPLTLQISEISSGRLVMYHPDTGTRLVSYDRHLIGKISQREWRGRVVYSPSLREKNIFTLVDLEDFSS